MTVHRIAPSTGYRLSGDSRKLRIREARFRLRRIDHRSMDSC